MAVPPAASVNNPGSVAAKARVTPLFDDGSTTVHDYDLPAKSRTNVPVASDFFLTTPTRFAITVESIGPRRCRSSSSAQPTRAREG